MNHSPLGSTLDDAIRAGGGDPEAVQAHAVAVVSRLDRRIAAKVAKLSPGARSALEAMAPPNRYPLSSLQPLGVGLEHLQELARYGWANAGGFWRLTEEGQHARRVALRLTDGLAPPP